MHVYRHLWDAAIKAGGLSMIDTMRMERSHKKNAHEVFKQTSKVHDGLEGRMARRHARALSLNALRRTPSPQKCPVRPHLTAGQTVRTQPPQPALGRFCLNIQ